MKKQEMFWRAMKASLWTGLVVFLVILTRGCEEMACLANFTAILIGPLALIATFFTVLCYDYSRQTLKTWPVVVGVIPASILGALFGISLTQSGVLAFPSAFTVFFVKYWWIGAILIIGALIAARNKKAITVLFIIAIITNAALYQTTVTIGRGEVLHYINQERFEKQEMLHQAILTNNSELCMELDVTSQGFCIRELAERNEDLSFCDLIKDAAHRAGCFTHFAKLRKDITLCEGLLKTRFEDRRGTCITDVAAVAKQPELCNQLAESSVAYCIEIVERRIARGETYPPELTEQGKKRLACDQLPTYVEAQKCKIALSTGLTEKGKQSLICDLLPTYQEAEECRRSIVAS